MFHRDARILFAHVSKYVDKILFMQMVSVSTSLIQTWNILLQRAGVVVGIKRRAGVATALLCPIYLDLEIRASNEGYTKVRQDTIHAEQTTNVCVYLHFTHSKLM